MGMGVWEFDVRGRFFIFFLHKRRKDLDGRDSKYTRAPLLIEPFRVEK